VGEDARRTAAETAALRRQISFGKLRVPLDNVPACLYAINSKVPKAVASMALLWLRFALGCYFIGLVYAFVALTRPSDLFSRIALHAASLGMVFHFVSLVEIFLTEQGVWASVHNSESLLAFLSMTFFMIVYSIYKTTSPGVVVFPIVFFLTFVAAVDQQPVLLTAFVKHRGWLVAHIILIFTGYAALVLSFGASLLYLLQERRLKAKKATSLTSFLPALEVIDQIGYRSLLLGFPFMTLGLITGSIVAMSAYGRVDFLDPKILLSVLMWAVYMLMVFTRWNSGWRGRRAAVLATFAFVAALAAWAANYFSTIHRFVAS
jgi:ABC-type uncharacterized transport system permease subunit